MRLDEMARLLDACIYAGPEASAREVRTVHSAVTMSGLIAHASAETLLVTSLNNSQLIRVAELMDTPGLCLTGSVRPQEDLLAMARRCGVLIMVSRHDLQHTRQLAESFLSARTARA